VLALLSPSPLLCAEKKQFQLKEGRANGYLAGAIGARTSVIFMPPRQILNLGDGQFQQFR
jgi:hypothetical protein